MSGDFCQQLHSFQNLLTVDVLNYGERQPGAEDVILHFSRPIGPHHCMCLSSTNGAAKFSPNGKYLIVHDLFSIIAVAITAGAAPLEAWHFSVPQRHLLLSLAWDDECVVGQTLGYGKPMDAVTRLGPWTWDVLVATWQPGLGEKLTIQPCR